MKKIVIFMVIAVLSCSMAHIACASEEADSMALAKKAARFIKEQGVEKGIAEIMNPNGSLRKGNVLMTASDFKGTILAHAANPKLMGQNHYNVKDLDGKYFQREATEIAKTKGGGWLSFKIADPETKKIMSLKAWVQPVEGKEMFVMAPIQAPTN